jgi:hypothetical protein
MTGRTRDGAPSLQACSWSSSAAGRLVTRSAAIAGGRARRHARGRARARRQFTMSAATLVRRARRHARGRARRLVTMSAAISGAPTSPPCSWPSSAAGSPSRRRLPRAELAGTLAVELELGGWPPGRRRSPAWPRSPACELGGWFTRIAPRQRRDPVQPCRMPWAPPAPGPSPRRDRCRPVKNGIQIVRPW